VTCESSGHYWTRGGERSLADYAEGVRAVIDAVGVQEASIVGLSMGGMIAQELALLDPERVSSLVLISTTSSYPGAARTQLAARAEVAETEGMDPLLDAIVGRWLTDGFRVKHPEIVNQVRSDLAEANPAAYAQAARAVARVDTRSRLKEIQAPVLVIHGGLDESLPADAAATLVAGIPLARRVTIEDAAHLCNVEAASEFNSILQTHFDSLRLAPEDDDTSVMSPW
jgi:3-oxoadipate enol-lactonase